ncbi:MAG: Hsp20/alpha crystallin family protein [Thermodesulfobacteriota bacterium]
MADTTGKELQAKQKTEVNASAEQTAPGAVFVPAVDIFESEKEITLLADLPGVKADDLKIDLRDNVLTLSGEIAPIEGPDEKDIFIEYETGKYYRQFSLSEVINQNKIDARLEDGVLRLVLPKSEKVVPKKITVKAA